MKKSLLALVFAFFALNINAQTWETVGGNVLGNDIHGFGIWNNQLAIGGSFNGNPCDKVVLFDSTNWICPAGGIGAVVRAVVSYNGNLVAVGDFWNTNQPCTNCNGVAMWNGTSWTNLGTGFNNDVLCLAVWNGNLVAGGDFTTADGNTCYRVAMWNGTNWSAIGGLDTAFNNDVRALAVYNGELWVGGDFSNANGCTACDRIVKWSGTAWVGGNSGVDIPGGLDSTVRVLYTDPVANRLYMGGHFLEVGGNTNCSGVAYYDGSAWFAMGSGVNSYVRGITRYNGNIIVGGDFTTAGGSSANRVAKWNPTSNTWSAMGSGMDAYLRALIEYKGELYAGGSFHNAGGQTRDYIAKWYETPSVPPTANFSVSDNTICLGQCVTFTDLSNGAPTTWNWTFGVGATPSTSTLQNPPSVCYPTGGTKTVTLQACNSFGCNTYTTTITVSASAPPSVSLNGNTNICAGQSTTLSAAGASSYSWSPATGLSATTGSSVVATPTATIKYYVTGTTAGCTDIDSITVAVNPAPTVAVSPASVSICPSTSATLTASGATSYSWSPATGLSSTATSTVSASPSVTTTYTVTGTSGGCSNTATVTVNSGAAGSLPVVEGFQTPFTPANWSLADGGADGNVWQQHLTVGSFGTSTSCAWFPNNSVNAPGTKDELRTARYDFSNYTSAKMYFDVAYTRKNNASFSDTLVVYASTDCGQNWSQIYIKGGSALATAPNQNGAFTPTSAEWRTDTVYLNSYLGQSSVLFAFQNRNYNGNNLYLDNINISAVNTNPPVAGMTLNNDSVCVGACFNVSDNSSGGATSWNWSFPGAVQPAANVQNPGNVCYANAGTYTITLQACNANGCNTASQTVTVLPAPVANAGADTSVCLGNTIQLSASGGVNYTWQPLGGLSCGSCANPVAMPGTTVTYTVNVTDAFGCTSSDDVLIVVGNPTANAGFDATVCAGDSTMLNGGGGVFYAWSPATGLSCTSCPNPYAAPSASTTYTLTVTDGNGCSATDDVIVNVTVCAGVEGTTRSVFSMFPNPTSGNFTIGATENISGVEVVNVLGDVVLHKEKCGKSTTLSLVNLPDGVYFVRVKTDGAQTVKRLVLSR